MTNLEEFLAHVRQSTDAALDRLVPGVDVEPRRLHEAVRWSLFGGGKRIRPAIVFAAGRAFGAADGALEAAAAAVEMVHTYSLIHDDLPAMDDDDLRRGRATCHRQFDESTAILAGDVLQTLAFKAIADDPQLEPSIRVRVIALVASGAGTPGGMVSGQQLDLDAEGRTLDIAQIEEIHTQKTGALIRAAAAAGAVIGGASESELAAVEAFAGRLGLLFQITDDLLDVTATTEKLGKTAGKDAASRKATFVSLLGVDESRKVARAAHSAALAALAAVDKDTTLLAGLADTVLNRTQ